MEPERVLLHYRLVEKIGAGGMGEVYRAEDTKLGREVALKILPSELAESADRRARFEREARSVAALNHPNIVTLYSIEQAGETHFITMELVSGVTLSKCIPANGLALETFFDLAVALADAVAAAHEKGVVHRDLKPDNIMVTGERRLKVLDFGLARRNPLSADAVGSNVATLSATVEGRIVGTVHYMSPEQAEGKRVDARSDIFSMGIVFYEMLTGRRPFEGDSVAAVLSAILRAEPPGPGSVNPAVPEELESVLRRCLAKDPEERFQTAGELVSELRGLKDRLASGGFTVRTAAIRRILGGRAARFGLAAVALAGIGSLSLYLARSLRAPGGETFSATPITTAPGPEREPALSPDGQHVAFVGTETPGAAPQLYVQQVGGSRAFPRTTGVGPVFQPAWSPDGTAVAFLRREARGSFGLFSTPLLGGEERRIGPNVSSRFTLSWSPDGRRLAVSHDDGLGGGRGIFLVSVSTMELIRLTSPQPVADENFPNDSLGVFSPDGHQLAFVRREQPVVADVYVVELEGEQEPTRVADISGFINGLDWAPDGRSLVYSLTRNEGSGLWRVGLSGGEPKPLLGGRNFTRTVSISRSGGRLVYEEERGGDLDIWRVPFEAKADGDATALVVSRMDEWMPEYSPDGHAIAFVSNRTGNTEIWRVDGDGARAVRLSNFGRAAVFNPRWSPDSSTLAVSAAVEKHFELFLLPADGGPARPLARGDGFAGFPTWSTDGETVFFGAEWDGSSRIWRVGAAGGEARPISSAGLFPIASPDGAWVYFTRPGEAGIWKVPVEGGPESQVHDRGSMYIWNVYDGGVCYVETVDEPAIDCVELATGETMRVVALERIGDPYGGLSVSPDRSYILYTLSNPEESDVMLIEPFR